MKFIYSDSLDFIDPGYDFLEDRPSPDREAYWTDRFPHEYLDHPPTLAELRAIVAKLGIAPLDVIRTKEKRFKELGLSKQDQRSDDEWLRVIVDNPMLLERPIVVAGKKAALGRPPENVLDIL